MIVIFLDIDGVLLDLWKRNTAYGYLVQRYNEQNIEPSKRDFSSAAYDKMRVELFDELALKRLDSLIDAIERRGEKVGIVISSAWRENLSVDQLKELFKYKFAEKIIGKTADRIKVQDHEISFREYLDRGEEIDVWLQQNKEKWDVSNFIILDDDDDAISELFPDNFVLCSEGTFSQKNLEQTCSRLEKPLAEVKDENHPVNTLSLTIKHESSSVVTNERVRLTVAKQNTYLSQFFSVKTTLSVKTSESRKHCSTLIEEYRERDIRWCY